MQVVYAFLWAKVLIFQGSAHQNGVGSLSILVVSYRQTMEKLCFYVGIFVIKYNKDR